MQCYVSTLKYKLRFSSTRIFTPLNKFYKLKICLITKRTLHSTTIITFLRTLKRAGTFLLHQNAALKYKLNNIFCNMWQSYFYSKVKVAVWCGDDGYTNKKLNILRYDLLVFRRENSELF